MAVEFLETKNDVSGCVFVTAWGAGNLVERVHLVVGLEGEPGAALHLRSTQAKSSCKITHGADLRDLVAFVGAREAPPLAAVQEHAGQGVTIRQWLLR